MDSDCSYRKLFLNGFGQENKLNLALVGLIICINFIKLSCTKVNNLHWFKTAIQFKLKRNDVLDRMKFGE